MRIIELLVQAVLYFFTLSVVAVCSVPAFRPLLQYGKVLSPSNDSHTYLSLPSLLTKTVPKNWFLHFYITGFMSSLICIFVLILAKQERDAKLLRILACLDDTIVDFLSSWGVTTYTPCVSFPSSQYALSLFLLQCVRRWYESKYVEKMSTTARIRLGHYIVGQAFYICCALAFAADGIAMAAINSYAEFDRQSLLAVFAGMILYLTSAYAQYNAHRQLASLVKYSPPPATKLFRYLVCPHYTAEILIYISIPIVCGALTPGTTAVVVWTIVNLCASAEQSREFYTRRFGESSVAGKWKVIPLFW
ncbi:uncharacterized protein V1516DRAFT_679042 [Lipomyces oligophaga]|uniref:uncharacterized protein n=1 Tax=Lipomyces oligophaga TaxID=45792 RepID=UPI0034CE2823